jgi:hypothetical protein
MLQSPRLLVAILRLLGKAVCATALPEWGVALSNSAWSTALRLTAPEQMHDLVIFCD